jgi:hypothetical protein
MEHELECPKCNHKFFISEDYQVGDCSNCGKAHYYWDYVLDEETRKGGYCPCRKISY